MTTTDLTRRHLLDHLDALTRDRAACREWVLTLERYVKGLSRAGYCTEAAAYDLRAAVAELGDWDDRVHVMKARIAALAAGTD